MRNRVGRKVSIAIMISGILTMGSDVFAAKKKQRDSDDGEVAAKYVTPWGMAGCGLWTYVIQDKSQGAQLGVWALRKLVFDSQTSAISSGTSNCVSTRLEAAQNEREVFVTVNLASLSREAAQGNGEHLNALAEIFGCPHSEFAKLSQDHYETIFNSYEPNGVLQNYLHQVVSDEALSKSCIRAT